MSSSSSKRRRRKRLRTQLTDQGESYNGANEPGPSRRDIHITSGPSSEMKSVVSCGSQPGGSRIGIRSRRRLTAHRGHGNIDDVQSVSPMVATSQPTRSY